MNFTTRSLQRELLDGNDIPFHAIERNMLELDFINTWLGGHEITVAGFKKLLIPGEEIIACEIGCGGGDNIRALTRFCQQKKIKAKFSGVDINPDCIGVARSRFHAEDQASSHSLPAFVCSDYRSLKFEHDKPDILFSSLFCHHFTDAELVPMLQWMQSNSTTGFFINDLHRHPLAYYSIRLLTRLFSRSYLVKNDAPLSVLRGFRRKEWEALLQSAGIAGYSIQWKWAFRWLITVKN